MIVYPYLSLSVTVSKSSLVEARGRVQVHTTIVVSAKNEKESLYPTKHRIYYLRTVYWARFTSVYATLIGRY